jgi:hypothetical protein
MNAYAIVKSRNPNGAHLQVRVLRMQDESIVSEETFTNGAAKEFRLREDEALLVTTVAKPAEAAVPVAAVPDPARKSFLSRLFGWQK